MKKILVGSLIVFILHYILLWFNTIPWYYNAILAFLSGVGFVMVIMIGMMEEMKGSEWSEHDV